MHLLAKWCAPLLLVFGGCQVNRVPTSNVPGEPLQLNCLFVGDLELSCVLENHGPSAITVSNYLLGEPANLETVAVGATMGTRLATFSGLSAGAFENNLRTLAPGGSLPAFKVTLRTVPVGAFVLRQHLGNDGIAGWAGEVVSNELRQP